MTERLAELAGRAATLFPPAAADGRSLYPLDDVSLLNRIIECARGALELKACHEPHRVSALYVDCRRAYDRPCDGDRVIDHHTLLFAQAIEIADDALHHFDRARAAKINRYIAAGLADIQDDLVRALKIRAETRPTP